MKRLVLLAPAVVLAAACGSNSSSIQPGQWEMTTRFTSVEMPGLPEAAAKQMQADLANRPQVQTTCITPAQAANPAGGMFSQDPEGCNFTDQTFSGGVIRVRGTCQAPGGQGQMQMSWEGRYTETTMEGNLNAEVTGGPQNMRMSGTMTSRRVGDCPSG
jgi:Protein of unknown function (DUF3617)